MPTVPDGTDFVAVAAFQARTAELMRRIGGVNAEVGRVRTRLRFMRAALEETPRAPLSLHGRREP